MSTPLLREVKPQFLPLHDAPAPLKPLAGSDRVVGAKVKNSDPHAQLNEQTEKWVAQTFYGTLLKQMHESPFKASWVDGGRGGQAFQPLLDQRLADHMTRASGKKLVRSIVRKIEGKRAYAKTHKDSANGEHETRHHVPAGLRA